jgi:hypothetical protein
MRVAVVAVALPLYVCEYILTGFGRFDITHRRIARMHGAIDGIINWT